MPTFTWRIDDPVIKDSGNPTDEDLRGLHAEGFDHAVSLLKEDMQPPRYDKHSAEAAGWSIYSIPIEEGCAPSLEQIREFVEHLEALRPGTKILVFCDSGLGRTAFMGAVYWVTKGLSSKDATARVSAACSASDWATPNGSASSMNTRG